MQIPTWLLAVVRQLEQLDVADIADTGGYDAVSCTG
jgi:hypothetical protein